MLSPTICASPADKTVTVLDQTRLPHRVEFVTLRTLDDAVRAIRDMLVRGAPLIGVTAAYGVALAMVADASDAGLGGAYDRLFASRPTAVNLRWALDRMRAVLLPALAKERRAMAWAEAERIAEEDVVTNLMIGLHGLEYLRGIAKGLSRPLQIMTHCNAGRLCAVAHGTALAPIYAAFNAGIPLHVWVSETRPRNQGAALTAWELVERGVPHTLIADNGAGLLMQRGLVDVVITGADRVTGTGDVANKVGTYLKALAARAHGLPFLVAIPKSTIDWTLTDGLAEIPIEQRDGAELTHMTGLTSAGELATIRLCPVGTAARNDAFDITPAGLITAFVTERGVCRELRR
jgi:methylthioribose-1-phosphate isomerase